MISLSQKQIILGGLLGDSSCSLKKIISFSQSERQKEYLIWKSRFFDKEDDIKCTYSIFNNNKYLKCYFYYYIKKEDEYFFSFIRKNLYSRGRKKISLKYLNELTPLGLAVWWMDDGCLAISKKNRYGKLSTECFNYEEHLLIQKYFKEKWDINVQIKIEKNKYYFLRFNVTELKKLIKIIYKYVCNVPSMVYKIDLQYTYDRCIGKDFEEIYYYIKNVKDNLSNTDELLIGA